MRYIKSYKLHESNGDDNIQKYQSEYNELLNRKSQIKKEINDFKSSLKSKGYYITDKDNVKKLKDEWGVFWDTTYYDHWSDGDWIYSYSSGASSLKEEQVDAIRELIACWDIYEFDKKKDLLEIALNFGNYSTNLPEKIAEDMNEFGADSLEGNEFSGRYVNYKFDVTDSSLKITVKDGDHEEWTPVDGAYILYKLSSNDEIKSFKKKSGRGY